MVHQPHNRATWFNGKDVACQPLPRPQDHVYRLVVLGPPGVGKGTQTELLAQALGACHLPTGEVFRAAKRLAACDRSLALTAALKAMTRGELVSDAIVVDMIAERVDCLRCRGGFQLDGFPLAPRGAATRRLACNQQNLHATSKSCQHTPPVTSRRSAWPRCAQWRPPGTPSAPDAGTPAGRW
jgi:hypothetical protein